MKNEEKLREKILKEEDFINCPRMGNSIKKLMNKNPDGIDEERMSKLLLMSEDEIKNIYLKALSKIKKKLGV